MSTLSQCDFVRCLDSDAFVDADKALARFTAERSDSENHWLPLAAALTMRWARMGHTFFDLSDSEGLARQLLPKGTEWPIESDWTEHLNSSDFVGSAGDQNAPLIFEEPTSLYLNRYYTHESQLAKKILYLVSDSPPQLPEGNAHSTSLHQTQIDAIQKALANRFHIITGGPGTGKTTIALHYLKALIQNNTLGDRPRIAAVAPTGKAAARLQETISSGIDKLDTNQSIKESLQSISCQTIHRLLGYIPFKTTFRRNERNPLLLNVIVIDEASMIDLPLMNRLFKAIPNHCRILMLGDPDQLASVEVGTTFADFLAASAPPQSPLNAAVSRLTKTYRFSEDSAIRRICDSTRTGNETEVQAILDSERDDFAFHPTSMEKSGNLETAYREILDRHQRIISASSHDQALAELSTFMILSPMRTSPLGTHALNSEIHRRITGRRPTSIEQIYHGAPIMIIENDYDQELFNGDLGIVWQPNPGESAKALFLKNGKPETHLLSVISRYELANAMTIHKSQGSEFDTVAVIFDHTEPRFLTRELLYTAMSRAKSKLLLFGRKNVISESVVRQVSRATGLAEKLSMKWGGQRQIPIKS